MMFSFFDLKEKKRFKKLPQAVSFLLVFHWKKLNRFLGKKLIALPSLFYDSFSMQTIETNLAHKHVQ